LKKVMYRKRGDFSRGSGYVGGGTKKGGGFSVNPPPPPPQLIAERLEEAKTDHVPESTAPRNRSDWNQEKG